MYYRADMYEYIKQVHKFSIRANMCVIFATLLDTVGGNVVYNRAIHI